VATAQGTLLPFSFERYIAQSNNLTDFDHSGPVPPNFGLYSEANQLTHGQKENTGTLL